MVIERFYSSASSLAKILEHEKVFKCQKNVAVLIWDSLRSLPV